MRTFCATLFLYLALAVISAEDVSDPHKASREKCRVEFGFSEEELKKGKYDLEPMKCYLYCFMKDIDVMDAIGNFDPEAGTQAIEESLQEEARPSVFKCHEETKEVREPCEHAYELVKCFSNANPEIYELLGIFTPRQKKQQ